MINRLHNKEKVEFPIDQERREFLKIGLKITGVVAGGSILSLISNINKAYSLDIFRDKYPYKPHYAMVLRQDRCIDCKKCMVACVATNSVPDYGWRTRIFKREVPTSIDQKVGIHSCLVQSMQQSSLCADLSDTGNV